MSAAEPPPFGNSAGAPASSSSGVALQLLTSMKRGAKVMKLGRAGKPHFCFFNLSNDETCLQWYSDKKKSKRSVPLSSVIEVRRGQNTEVFARFSKDLRRMAHLSFSLIHFDDGKERTLDLVMREEMDFRTWTAGIELLLSDMTAIDKGDERSHRMSMRNMQKHKHAARDLSKVASERRSSDENSPTVEGVGSVNSIHAPTDAGSDDSMSIASSSITGSELSRSDIFGSDAEFFRKWQISGVAPTNPYLSDMPPGEEGSFLHAPKKTLGLGDVYVWGFGMGLKSEEEGEEDSGARPRHQLTPRHASVSHDIDAFLVAAGRGHIAVVDDSGDLFCWGDGTHGQLGTGIYGYSAHKPQKVQADPWLNGALADYVACSSKSTAVVTSKGEIFSWGNGDQGNLGHSSSTEAYLFSLPQRINYFYDRSIQIVLVAMGPHHSAAVSAGHVLYTWGEGLFGALGHGDPVQQLIPKKVEVLAKKKTVMVACGVWHSLAIVLDQESESDRIGGQVYSWGDSSKGQLGYGGKGRSFSPAIVPTIQSVPIVAIAAGMQHTVALSVMGEVFTWGACEDGVLGHGPMGPKHPDNKEPARIESLYSKGIRVSQIACGFEHTAIMASEPRAGAIYTWGKGSYGRLGHGGESSVDVPTVVHALASNVVRQVSCGEAWTATICEHAWDPEESSKLEREAQGGRGRKKVDALTEMKMAISSTSSRGGPSSKGMMTDRKGGNAGARQAGPYVADKASAMNPEMRKLKLALEKMKSNEKQLKIAIQDLERSARRTEYASNARRSQQREGASSGTATPHKKNLESYEASSSHKLTALAQGVLEETNYLSTCIPPDSEDVFSVEAIISSLTRSGAAAEEQTKNIHKVTSGVYLVVDRTVIESAAATPAPENPQGSRVRNTPSTLSTLLGRVKPRRQSRKATASYIDMDEGGSSPGTPPPAKGKNRGTGDEEN